MEIPGVSGRTSVVVFQPRPWILNQDSVLGDGNLAAPRGLCWHAWLLFAVLLGAQVAPVAIGDADVSLPGDRINLDSRLTLWIHGVFWIFTILVKVMIVENVGPESKHTRVEALRFPYLADASVKGNDAVLVFWPLADVNITSQQRNQVLRDVASSQIGRHKGGLLSVPGEDFFDHFGHDDAALGVGEDDEGASLVGSLLKEDLEGSSDIVCRHLHPGPETVSRKSESARDERDLHGVHEFLNL